MRGDRLDLESSLKELDLARNTDFFSPGTETKVNRRRPRKMSRSSDRN